MRKNIASALARLLIPVAAVAVLWTATAAPAEAAPSHSIPPPIPCFHSHFHADRPGAVMNWTQDGGHLVLLHNSRLYAVDANGLSVRLITDTRAPISQYEFWREFHQSRYPSLYEDEPGMVQTFLAENKWEHKAIRYGTMGTYADISPDGSKVIYSTCQYLTGPGKHFYRFELAQWDFDRGSARRLTTNHYYDGYPAWAPDGIHIAFIAAPLFEGPAELRVAARRGDGKKSLPMRC